MNEGSWLSRIPAAPLAESVCKCESSAVTLLTLASSFLVISPDHASLNSCSRMETHKIKQNQGKKWGLMLLSSRVDFHKSKYGAMESLLSIKILLSVGWSIAWLETDTSNELPHITLPPLLTPNPRPHKTGNPSTVSWQNGNWLKLRIGPILMINLSWGSEIQRSNLSQDHF